VEPNEHSCGRKADIGSAASVASIRHVLSDNHNLELKQHRLVFRDLSTLL